MDPIEQFLSNFESSKPQFTLPSSLIQFDQIFDGLYFVRTLPVLVAIGASFFWYLFWISDFVDLYDSLDLRIIFEFGGFDFCLLIVPIVVLSAAGMSILKIAWILSLWLWFVDRGLHQLGFYVDVMYGEMIEDALEDAIDSVEDWLVLVAGYFLEKFGVDLSETVEDFGLILTVVVGWSILFCFLAFFPSC